MSEPLLYSLRRAARVLGVGRNNTLAKLLANGSLRTVTIAGRRYIPREQLEELARHGENPSESRADAPPKRKNKASKAGSIADLKIV